MIASDTPIYEDGEYCEVCGVTERLGTMTTCGQQFTICEPCHKDDAKLKAWFVQELEAAMRSDPRFEQLPDGRWRTVRA